jgi:hypothetical protein
MRYTIGGVAPHCWILVILATANSSSSRNARCGADCQLIGDVYVSVDVDLDVSDSEVVLHPFPVQEWWPNRLICSACGLRLEDREQLTWSAWRKRAAIREGLRTHSKRKSKRLNARSNSAPGIDVDHGDTYSKHPHFDHGDTNHGWLGFDQVIVSMSRLVICCWIGRVDSLG